MITPLHRGFMQDVNVKAVPVNGLYQFVAKELTPDDLRRVLESLGANARYFNGHLLANDIVPLKLVNEFTTLAAQTKREAIKTFGRRAGRFGAELGIKSVYRFVLAILSTESVLKKAPFMWTRVYDGGTMVVSADKKRATIRVTDFPGNEAGCARITGWFETIGEHAGARNLRCAHLTCTGAGADACVWEFAWS